jgi:hypothetical protein
MKVVELETDLQTKSQTDIFTSTTSSPLRLHPEGARGLGNKLHPQVLHEPEWPVKWHPEEQPGAGEVAKSGCGSAVPQIQPL